MNHRPSFRKGRGALSNPAGRFETVQKEALAEEEIYLQADAAAEYQPGSGSSTTTRKRADRAHQHTETEEFSGGTPFTTDQAHSTVRSPAVEGQGRRGDANAQPDAVDETECSVSQDAEGAMDAPDSVPRLRTSLSAEPVRTIISKNDSPDIPFNLSINPYRGCEHGCIYCYARPSHAYLNLSPGLDFETKLFYKPNAAEVLEQQLSHPGYRCEPITIGANTDPYQPVEKELGITRSLLAVMLRYRQPLTIITKGALIERDLDLLERLATQQLVQVMISITSLKNGIKRSLEPRAASAQTRLKLVGRLHQIGVPTGVLVAPVIPALTDDELEDILDAAAAQGAYRAGYILLRLPWEVKDLFREWLQQHFPMRATHVMSLIQQSRNGQDYDARFGTRMRGQGQFAELIAQRFTLACKRNGLNQAHIRLDTRHFQVPQREGDQLSLF